MAGSSLPETWQALIFKTFDKDGDGLLSKDEFAAAFPMLLGLYKSSKAGCTNGGSATPNSNTTGAASTSTHPVPSVPVSAAATNQSTAAPAAAASHGLLHPHQLLSSPTSSKPQTELPMGPLQSHAARLSLLPLPAANSGSTVQTAHTAEQQAQPSQVHQLLHPASASAPSAAPQPPLVHTGGFLGYGHAPRPSQQGGSSAQCQLPPSYPPAGEGPAAGRVQGG
eukprot:CAMPEP_0202863874 /NCGR_PEP_ID=MMETSP1391-20130828/4336_1 /ASSEMBLY_ACC=CAM_ASM_000867 /TAXON_ID=1034604 /ORGANISM="Chlamydomonas leiostraca, Strain SAG 11-49" /LENGTH=223 /DNA_ID=CAMNT_0049543553 /DNA_START=96 /DNA_END=763 /DNA_ORIENTATION=-